jgi:hypothetical protein
VKKYLINEERIVIREIDEHLIILDVESGEFISTAGTGRTILELLMQNKNNEEIVAEIESKYDVNDNFNVTDDVENFIKQLTEKKIVIDN